LAAILEQTKNSSSDAIFNELKAAPASDRKKKPWYEITKANHEQKK